MKRQIPLAVGSFWLLSALAACDRSAAPAGSPDDRMIPASRIQPQAAPDDAPKPVDDVPPAPVPAPPASETEPPSDVMEGEMDSDPSDDPPPPEVTPRTESPPSSGPDGDAGARQNWIDDTGNTIQ